jgi:hypothetical protein
MGKSFGVETVPTGVTRLVFWGGAVNGREVLACPKLQHSIETVYRMLSVAAEGRARALYDRRGAPLQRPP